MLNISHLRLQTWAFFPPPACSLSPVAGGVGVSGPSEVTELPRRSLRDLLLSGEAMLTARIAYFDCNETGSSPTPNRMGTSRAQQTPAERWPSTITYSRHVCAQRKSWRWLYREARLNFRFRAVHRMIWNELLTPSLVLGRHETLPLCEEVCLSRETNEDGNDSCTPTGDRWGTGMQDGASHAAPAYAVLL